MRNFGDHDAERFGHITAVDADSGHALWKYDTDTPMLASVTPTAGGLILTGDTKGHFLAFDASNGNVLLKEDSGDPIGGGVAPYMVDGRAWVAILSLPDHSNR